MSSTSKRPNILVSLILLACSIALGAHLSALPFLLAKAGVATILVFVYGYFAVRIVGAMQIGSSGTRSFIGLMLGMATLYITWAVRIPVFAGWETPFTVDPELLYGAIIDRAGSMEISKGFGNGSTTDGPSWLLLGTYLVEAVAFVGVMFLCAWISAPDGDEKTASSEQHLNNAA